MIQSKFMDGAEFFVAVDNKGLWPSLIHLPDGGIGAAVYNHPSHGYGTGSDVELWFSENGRFWEYRSTISDRGDNPESIRMNHAIGVNAKGELVAFVSGYQKGQRRPLLPLQLCISDNNGIDWQHSVLDLDGGYGFGSILTLPDGELLAAVVKGVDPRGETEKPRTTDSTVFSSRDHGRTWTQKSTICGDGNETHLLRCSNGDLLAAVRMKCKDRLDRAVPHGSGERLYRSSDGGGTWDDGMLISPQGQENANLLELRDGRMLCCFTSRIPGLFGVVCRTSEGMGQTWGEFKPMIAISATDWHKTDAGYPSSLQLDDGTIVTAYYFGPKQPEFARHTTPWHQRYHMGVSIYSESDL